MSIVVNTPSGNIGRPLVEALLARGEAVTILSRNPDKVADLVSKGARLVEGSIDDRAALERAFTGAEAVFWLTPPAYTPSFAEWAVRAANDAASIAKAKGVKRAVVLSSIGAQNGPGSGPVGVLLAVEDAFRGALADVTVLRAGFFMENVLRDLGTITALGSIFSPIPADKKVPVVATRDIADAALEALIDRATHGHHVQGVHGPEDLSQRDMAAILSEVLHKPVSYVEVTIEAAKKGMADAGMPPFLVSLFAEMLQAIRDGRMDSAEPRTPRSTTKTRFVDFAREVVKPAALAALPKRSPFMAVAHVDLSKMDEIQKLVPSERARVAELTKEGTFTKVQLSTDYKVVFIEVAAASADAAREAVSSLPLYKFMKVELFALQAPLSAS